MMNSVYIEDRTVLLLIEIYMISIRMCPSTIKFSEAFWPSWYTIGLLFSIGYLYNGLALTCFYKMRTSKKQNQQETKLKEYRAQKKYLPRTYTKPELTGLRMKNQRRLKKKIYANS